MVGAVPEGAVDSRGHPAPRLVSTQCVATFTFLVAEKVKKNEGPIALDKGSIRTKLCGKRRQNECAVAVPVVGKRSLRHPTNCFSPYLGQDVIFSTIQNSLHVCHHTEVIHAFSLPKAQVTCDVLNFQLLSTPRTSSCDSEYVWAITNP